MEDSSDIQNKAELTLVTQVKVDSLPDLIRAQLLRLNCDKTAEFIVRHFTFSLSRAAAA